MIEYLEIDDTGKAIGGIYHLNPANALPDSWIEISDEASIGSIWDGSSWGDPVTLVSIYELRANRNRMLRDSDWTQFNDAPMTEEKKKEWAVYRQDLRDLPNDYTEIEHPIFPDKPL